MRNSDRFARPATWPGYLGPLWTILEKAIDTWRREDFLVGKAAVLSTWWFEGLVTVVGIAWIAHFVRQPANEDDRINEGWLADRLRECRGEDGAPLFRDKDLDSQQARDRHFTNLRDFGVFSKRRALQLMDSEYVRKFLNARYLEILERNLNPYPSPSKVWYVDPNGFTHWGAMLLQASWAERREVERYVTDRIRELRGHGAC